MQHPAAPTEHSMTYPPAQQPEPGPAIVLAPMKRRRWPWIVAAVLVVAAVGIGGVLLGRSGSKSSPATPSFPAVSTAASAPVVNVFSMTGALYQMVVADAPLMAVGDTCTGSGDYADVHVGSVISVFDPNGKLLATGAVNSSGYGYAEHASACRLNFTVPAVPDGLSTYGVEIAEHGVQQISSTEAHHTVWISSGP